VVVQIEDARWVPVEWCSRTKGAGRNSRHIKIEYFFVIDKIKDKEMKLIYYYKLH